MQPYRLRLGLIVLVCLAADSGASEPPPSKPGALTETDLREEGARCGLENLLRLPGSIFSGGEPRMQASFEFLSRLGVKTIVSVDGARPDVASAQKLGLRYVHIPIGYDGISHEAGASLARVVRELERPIFVHCHHGKHRGPAAATVLCIASGLVSADDAHHVLEEAGTSKDYAGLWRDVSTFKPPSPGDSLPELHETAPIDDLVAAMASIDRALDHLKLLSEHDWKAPSSHQDLVASREALLVQEGLSESARNLPNSYDQLFLRQLREAEAPARKLTRLLESEDTSDAASVLKSLDAACKRCHRTYRN